jgi:hypothetical protein
VKIKVGDIVLNEVTKSGKSKTQLAKDLKISRTGLQKILDREDMDSRYILAIGKSIRYDFSNEFPQLNTEVLNDIVGGNLFAEDANNFELRNQLLEIQQKYIRLLEQHVELLHQLKLT